MKITVRRSEYELLLQQYYTRKCTLRTTSSTGSLHLPKAFAMYSDNPGSLIDSVIETILHKETIKITQKNSYMGIFALSSVLGRPLFSIYPDRGNIIVQNDFHRLIYPRDM